MDELAEFLEKMAGRMAMQRQFFHVILRQLGRQGIDLEAISEHLHLQLANSPHTPGSDLQGIEAGAQEELHQLIEMVEALIEEEL